MSEDSRAANHDDGKLLYCSFWLERANTQVQLIANGPSVFVCDECVELCNDIIREELEERAERTRDKLPKPQEIKKVLDEYVIGQERTPSPGSCRWPCTTTTKRLTDARGAENGVRSRSDMPSLRRATFC